MIFLSYRRSRRAIVEPLVRLLEAHGIEAFFDCDDIDPLASFPQRIADGIADSHALLAWWSRDYGDSDHCLNEFRLAWQHARRQSSAVGRRLWVLNPEAEAAHIAAGELNEQNFLAPPAPGDAATASAFVERIQKKLAELLPEGPLAAEQSTATAPPLYKTPVGNPSFTGRNRELMRIHSLAHPARIGAQARDVAIQTHGMGGVGKTELALQYAHTFSTAYPRGVFWLNLAGFEPERYATEQLSAAAGDAWMAALETAVAENPALCSLLRDTEGRLRPIAAARGALACHLGDSPSLWVLDNVPHFAREDLRDQVLALWKAPSAHGRSLVTTRDGSAMDGFAPLSLAVLSAEDSLRLLAHYLRPANADEMQAAEQLVEDLDGHPQALNLLGRRVKMDGTHRAYRKEKDRIDAEGALPRIEAIAELLKPQLGAKARSIVASLALSIAPLDDAAKTMLLLAAAGAPGVPLPREMLLEAEWIHENASIIALNTLLRHSLLVPCREQSETSDHYVEIHGLVAETAQHLLDPDGSLLQYLRLALAAVLAPWLESATGDLASRQRLAAAAMQAHYLIDHLNGEAGIRLGSILGIFHYRNAYLNTALEIGLRMRERATTELGARHHLTLATISNLANTIKTQGDLANALDLQKSALVALRDTLGDEHPHTLMAINNLAGTLYAQGDLVNALDFHNLGLSIQQRTLGNEHPDTLMSMNNLAETLRACGDLAGALELGQSALAGRRHILGDEHPHTLASMKNLAETLYAQGDITTALELEKSALAGLRRILGDEHLETLMSMSNLAESLHAQGDLSGALELQKSVLAIRRRLLGDKHPHTLTAMNNLAGTTYAQGNTIGALDLFKSALEGRRHTLGDKHPLTLSSMGNLACILRSQGDLTGALELEKSALAMQQRTLGDEHPETLTTKSNLSTTLHALGDITGALELQKSVLTGRRRTLGDKHPDTLCIAWNLFATVRQHDAATAVDLFQTFLFPLLQTDPTSLPASSRAIYHELNDMLREETTP